mgnify:CR=1 FL=1
MSDIVAPLIIMGVTVWLLFINLGVNVYPGSVKYAEEQCASNGGWRSINERKLGYGKLTCNNSAVFTYDPDKLAKRRGE